MEKGEEVDQIAKGRSFFFSYFLTFDPTCGIDIAATKKQHPSLDESSATPRIEKLSRGKTSPRARMVIFARYGNSKPLNS